MAILERRHTNKLNLDDTDTLKCVVESSHNVNGHTEYRIKVQRGFNEEQNWYVSRRYNEFATLNAALQAANVDLPFPRKKILGNMNPEFIAERRNNLQVYLNSIMKNIVLASLLCVKVFLDPINYSPFLMENALQNVSMALRGNESFELKLPLKDIGWRIRKYHYLVSKKSECSDSYIMSWQSYGPDRILSEHDLKIVFKRLSSLEHPNIDKIIQAQSLEAGAFVVRRLYTNGTLKDLIYGTTYKDSYVNKYASTKHKYVFSTNEVANYGYQILVALKFFHLKGLPFGHLHTGNIIINDRKVLLTDYENSIIGVPTKLRALLIKNKKINTVEDVNIYCFGHVLYEMVYGEPLQESTCDSFPFCGSRDLITVLNMLLSTSACKRGMPKIDELLSHPFFLEVKVNYDPKINSNWAESHFRLSDIIKEHLKRVTACVEARLNNDQKRYQAERQQIKIQEFLNSEKAMQKRKRNHKNKQNGMLRSSSLNGLSPVNLCNSSERSASSLSMSSHNSSEVINTKDSSSVPIPPPPPPPPIVAQNRSLLLESICAFKKESLNKVQKL